MEILAMIIAALIGIALLALAIAHLLWSFGVMWPIRDQRLLARTVVGTAGVDRMPPRYVSFGVFLLTGASCIIAYSVADPQSGGSWLTALALLAGLVFLARGSLGYTASWQGQHPEEPFHTADRRNYSPLCLALGVGFLVLVLMRLI